MSNNEKSRVRCKSCSALLQFTLRPGLNRIKCPKCGKAVELSGHSVRIEPNKPATKPPTNKELPISPPPVVSTKTTSLDNKVEFDFDAIEAAKQRSKEAIPSRRIELPLQIRKGLSVRATLLISIGMLWLFIYGMIFTWNWNHSYTFIDKDGVFINNLGHVSHILYFLAVLRVTMFGFGIPLGIFLCIPSFAIYFLLPPKG